MKNKVKNIESQRLKFIEKSLKISKFFNKYDYSDINYINSITKVKIYCKSHKNFFNVRPDAHLQGIGCPLCNGGISYTKLEWIEKAVEKHGDKFDYSLIDYVNSETKVVIKCNNNHIFEMRPANHLAGQKCPECRKNKKLTINDFIERSNAIHRNKYDYSEIIWINTNTKVKIKCKHGYFYQIPKDHMKGHGCKYCNKSKGEEIIKNYLLEKKINFKQEHTFFNCKGVVRQLPFDFYLPDFNLCIEFDGRQHYESVKDFGGDTQFNKLKINDAIKNIYCLDNSIKLLRIPYWEKDIINLLNNYIMIA